MMMPLFLKSYFEDDELRRIFKSVIGTDDAEKVQNCIDIHLKKQMGLSTAKVLFIQSSIGVVFGLGLNNKSKVVLKVYSPKLPRSYLDEMNRVQHILFQENFPAPKVLSPIFNFGKTRAGIYQLIEGANENAHRSEIRLELAKYLAEFLNIVEKHKLKPVENFFQQASRGKLWPIPHNVLFDINKTSKGAGWIAERAREAKKIISNMHLTKMLAHTDWGVKNSVFRNKKLKGIFDWDSLGAISELEMLGCACAQFTADWESGIKVTPTPREGRLFVKAYQDFRRRKFTANEYRVISAAADYHIAIIARFEHAGSNDEIHPYQDLIKECGRKSFLFT